MKRSSYGTSALISVLVVAVGIAGCGAGNPALKNESAPKSIYSTVPHTPITTTEAARPGISVAPNSTEVMVGGRILMKPSMKGFCIDPTNGGCSMDVIASPYSSSPNYGVSENSDVGMQNPDSMPWPQGTYGGFKGDYVDIKCYITNGAETQDMNGNPVTADWYEIVMPEHYVTNSKVLAEIDKLNSGITSFSYESSRAILGWASIAWFNQQRPSSRVPRCS